MRACYDSHRALAPGGVFLAVELLLEKEAEGPTIPYVSSGDMHAAIWLEPTVPSWPPEGSSLLDTMWLMPVGSVTVEL
jgi:hypothetical protein